MKASRDVVAEVVLWQPARGEGYRANVDALHLARFARRAASARVAVDLGAGVGTVGLVLLREGGAKSLTLVERDPIVAALAAKNIEENGFVGRAELVVADVARPRTIAQAPFADLVVANPPYVLEGRGRPPRSTVRGSREGDLRPFVTCARALLGKRGRVCFVYPANETLRLFGELREVGLEPKRARYVHASRSRPARVVLVEARAGKAGGLVVEPPLFDADDR